MPRRPIKYVLIAGLVTFVFALAIGIILNVVNPETNTPIEKEIAEHMGFLIIYAILVAPFFETLLFQMLIIELAGLLTSNVVVKISVSAVIFGAVHLANSINNGIVIAITLGPVLGWTYIRWLEMTKTKAFFVTSFTHLVYNIPAVLVIFVSR